jgi:hypothetical protein
VQYRQRLYRDQKRKRNTALVAKVAIADVCVKNDGIEN